MIFPPFLSLFFLFPFLYFSVVPAYGRKTRPVLFLLSNILKKHSHFSTCLSAKQGDAVPCDL